MLSSPPSFLSLMKRFPLNFHISRSAWILGGSLVFLVLSVQLPGINRPFGGHFASYQSSVMASISRNMLREDFKDILVPKIDILIGGERAWHLNQYPFPSLAAAAVMRVCGGTFEFWGRMQAVFCNLLSILLCGLIGRKLMGPTQGWIAAYLYGLSPFSLIYGQAFMSEAMALAAFLAALFFYLSAVNRERNGWSYGQLTMAGLLLSTAITGRIHLILMGPIFAVDILRRRHPWKAAFLFGIASLSLPILWYGFTYVASANSSHVMTNIFIQKAERPMGAILYYLSPEFLSRLADTLGQRMMTPLIWPLFFAGLWTLAKRKFEGSLLIGGIFLNLILIILLPQKIIAHEFYLIALPPFMAWAAAAGALVLMEKIPIVRRKTVWIVLMAFYFALSFRYTYGPVFKNQKDIFEIKKAAAFVQLMTREDDKLIIFGRGPAVSVYYANRPSFNIDPSSLGGELVYYLKNPRFSKVDMREVAREEAAMKDYIHWMEYFHGHGARYFLAPKRSELEKVPDLLAYLKMTGESVSPSDADFYLFKLK